jgi:tRNA/rRNA methyltransferase
MNASKSLSCLNLSRRFIVILDRPEKPENLGLVARNMRNTGFKNLRLVQVDKIDPKSFVTAVHSREILETAEAFHTLEDSTADLDLVFAATSKKRKNFPSLPLEKAVEKMLSFPTSTKIGLLFGNERTGLTSEELLKSNFRYTIPQSTRQPSFNLASAVLITLYHISKSLSSDHEVLHEKPISREEQVNCIKLMLEKLEEKGFTHKSNKKHTEEMVTDIFSRLTMTDKDKKLLLAMFSKGVD